MQSTAMYAVHEALRKGFLKKVKSCSRCRKKGLRLEAHHPNYAQVYDVVWLCPACHRKWHRKHHARFPMEWVPIEEWPGWLFLQLTTNSRLRTELLKRYRTREEKQHLLEICDQLTIWSERIRKALTG
jgi:hypothetical protein